MVKDGTLGFRWREKMMRRSPPPLGGAYWIVLLWDKRATHVTAVACFQYADLILASLHLLRPPPARNRVVIKDIDGCQKGRGVVWRVGFDVEHRATRWRTLNV